MRPRPHPRSDDLITFCQQQVAADIPGASLSVNMKVDQSQALIKVTALAEEFQLFPVRCVTRSFAYIPRPITTRLQLWSTM